MPTTLEFAGAIAIGPGVGGSSGYAGTITAATDDGSIAPGDAVLIFTNEPGNGVLVTAGVADQTGFYLGSAIFNGATGYIFADGSELVDFGSYLIVFEVKDEIYGDTFSTVVNWWYDTDSIPLSPDPILSSSGGGGTGATDTPTIGPDNLTGTEADDQIDGLAGNDSIYGLGGNDGLKGGDGDDLLVGGDGDDRLPAGDGNDTSFGGEGNDRLGGGFGDDNLVGGNGNDGGGAGPGNDTILGGAGNDSFNGGYGRDYIDLGDGDDRSGGSYGNDTMYGGNGNDLLTGGNGNDEIFGDAGDDTINSGLGDDTVTGGDGADLFVFNALFGGGTTVITDFEDGLDTIRVTGLRNPPDPIGRLDITDTTYDGQAAVTMDYGSHTIIVVGVGSGDLTEADFLFT